MSDAVEIQDEVQEVPAEVNELRWANLRKRRGKFFVSGQTMAQSHVVVQAIMGECIVVRCEHHYDTDALEFAALSWQFRETLEGEMAPVYIWEVDNEDIPHATEAKGGILHEVTR